MPWKKLTEDSFILGIASGIVLLTACYYLLTAIRMIVVSSLGNPFAMAPPRVQLFTILINILFFRKLILKTEREETAKGLLFITLLSSFIYFFIFFHRQRANWS